MLADWVGTIAALLQLPQSWARKCVSCSVVCLAENIALAFCFSGVVCFVLFFLFIFVVCGLFCFVFVKCLGILKFSLETEQMSLRMKT